MLGRPRVTLDVGAAGPPRALTYVKLSGQKSRARRESLAQGVFDFRYQGGPRGKLRSPRRIECGAATVADLRLTGARQNGPSLTKGEAGAEDQFTRPPVDVDARIVRRRRRSMQVARPRCHPDGLPPG
jgi:hypothetical protein